ncbi:hypothetical protein [Halothiobacillus sp.]|uniref:hypothetical protein n=1 Tax=Halothiobacillus sp. TaxID=1891311 RepID=UPI0026179C65|nr:hypothetical protein [Halothiobacillus sp.]
MAIDVATLNKLIEQGQKLCVAESNVLTSLRPLFPGLMITQCPSSDVTETPFQAGDFFDLHLVDSRNHCWALTGQPEAATAVLLAMHVKAS